MKFAMVFPGQGSQSVGMLSALSEEYPIIKSYFETASAVLAYDLWALVTQGPKEQLDQTEFTQPALLTADVALYQLWIELQGSIPTMMAGHSLGEYSALVAAQALKFEDAVSLVAKRGQYMQQAVQPGEGAMAAIIGLDDAAIQQVCQDAEQEQVVSPANYNSIGQTVVAGSAEAVDRAIVLAKERGAKIAKRIPVSVPSHCGLMQPAAEKLSSDLKAISIEAPKIPVIQNAIAGVLDEPEAIRQALIDQLTNPVRWVETVQQLAENGIEHAVECGPGKVLAGLNKRIVKGMSTHLIGDVGALEQTINELRGK